MKKRHVALLVTLILVAGYETFWLAEDLIRSAAPVLTTGDTPR